MIQLPTPDRLTLGKIAVCVLYAYLVVGCQSKEIVKVDQCSAWSPIVPSLEDRMTDSTAEQILTHDCIGYRLGCWDTAGMSEFCPADTAK